MAKNVKDPMDVLLAEVERRKKLPGLHDYSYGRLIADTTEDERRRMIESAGVQENNAPLDAGKKEIVCQYCGKRVIMTVRCASNRKYCSVACQLAVNKQRAKKRLRGGEFQERKCERCGEVLSDSRYRLCEPCRTGKNT